MIPILADKLEKHKMYYLKITNLSDGTVSYKKMHFLSRHKVGKFTENGELINVQTANFILKSGKWSSKNEACGVFANNYDEVAKNQKWFNFLIDQLEIFLPEAENIKQKSKMRQYFANDLNIITNTDIGTQLKYYLSELL